ncbi:hypothetical protein QBC47DRAFT_384538 [Echria macrotheca]|uniref:Ketohexokinase n=1 Tax=Echria macrotheca TaxID=438768 RepID=A0AAJ0BAV1_9PEZI|nr:hypothetical protein QBC47DRAFT_384538 [Echria macrotheca]
MKHIVLVGACYLDTILEVPRFPLEDSKLRATGLQVRRGGNCPNTLEVLLQLLSGQDDVKPHLVSCLPNQQSAATRKILSSFGPDAAAVEVDFRHCLYRQDHHEPASSYIIRNCETGSRTIVNFNDLPEMTAEEFSTIANEIMQAGGDYWWHFEGRIPETTLQCIRHIRNVLPTCTISVEVEKPNREGLVELAAEADVVFYSRSWAESRGYDNAEACVRGEAASTKS